MRIIVLLFLISLSFSLKLNAQKYKQIWDLYLNGEFQQAIDTAHLQLKENDSNPELNLILGRAYTDIRQFETALPFLDKTIDNSHLVWTKAWAYAYLGVCYYFLDNYMQSKENLQLCIDLKATINSTKYAEKRQETFQLIDFYDNWKIAETTNIRFHFQNISKISDVLDFMNSRQSAYQSINKFFNIELQKKIDFYVWENPAQAEKIFGIPLGFANPELCLINSRRDQTTGHEIAHVIAGQAIPSKYKTRLINEGVAVYFDCSGRNRLKTARESLQGNSLNIEDLWENPDNYRDDLIYPIGGAFIEFISKKGTPQQLKQLIMDQRIESARQIYSDFEKLLNDFEKLF